MGNLEEPHSGLPSTDREQRLRGEVRGAGCSDFPWLPLRHWNLSAKLHSIISHKTIVLIIFMSPSSSFICEWRQGHNQFSCTLIWRLYAVISCITIFQVDSLAAASQCVDLLTPNERDMLSAITGHVVTLWQRVALNKLLIAEETSVKGFQWMNHFVSVLCSVSAPLTLHMSNSQLIQVCLFLL